MLSRLVESPRGKMATRGLRFGVSILTHNSRVSLWLLPVSHISTCSGNGSIKHFSNIKLLCPGLPSGFYRLLANLHES